MIHGTYRAVVGLLVMLAPAGVGAAQATQPAAGPAPGPGVVPAPPAIVVQVVPVQRAVVVQQEERTITSLSEIVQMRLDHGQLELRTSLSGGANGRQIYTVTQQDPSRVFQMQVRAPEGDQEWVTPRLLTLNCSMRPKLPDIDSRSISLRYQPTHLTMSMQDQAGGRARRSFSFQQTNNPQMLGQRERIQLSITQWNPANQANTQTLQASSLEELRREHPRQVEEFLRPLLRELEQEQLLAADPFVAWQVFSDEYKPRAPVEQRVTKLIAELGADDFKVRDRASEQLREMGPEAALTLMHLDLTKLKLGAEQQIRVAAVLEPYQTLSREQVDAMRDDPMFLMDCLCGPDPAVRAIALERLEKALKGPVKVDIQGDADARAAAVGKLRAEYLEQHPPQAE